MFTLSWKHRAETTESGVDGGKPGRSTIAAILAAMASLFAAVAVALLITVV